MAERKQSAPRAPRVVVTLSRSGGFAGITRRWTADSAVLGHDDAERLVALASAPGLTTQGPAAGAPDGAPPPAAMPDAFSYELTVKVGRSAASRLRFTDSDADDDVKALIAHVRAVGSA